MISVDFSRKEKDFPRIEPSVMRLTNYKSRAVHNSRVPFRYYNAVKDLDAFFFSARSITFYCRLQ